MIVAVLLCSSFHAAPTEWQLVVAGQLTFAAWLARLEFTISSERRCDANWRHDRKCRSARERNVTSWRRKQMWWIRRIPSAERRNPRS